MFWRGTVTCTITTRKPHVPIFFHQIHATKSGQTFEFIPGDKILMTEDHLLYSDWAYYLSIGAIKKTI